MRTSSTSWRATGSHLSTRWICSARISRRGQAACGWRMSNTAKDSGNARDDDLLRSV
jgi:hypothetical protein